MALSRHGQTVKLLLIDGHYYAYRSFFAIRDLTNSRGEPVNAIFGFVKTLRRMVKDLAPDRAAVIWDEGLPTRRTELQPEYKATRAEMPETLVPQLGYIRELVEHMGFASLGLPGTEADDLMASYAVAAVEAGHEVVLATNDKDLFQLVNHAVRVYSTNKTDLASPKDCFALLGGEAVRKKWGVDPQRIGDVLALIGDTVDNIAGVPGIGPKTAAGLISKHGSLDGLLAENFTSVENPKLRAKLEAARGQIEQNREMVRLDLDLPLPRSVKDLTISPRFEPYIAALVHCEFKTLLAEVRSEAETASAPRQGDLFDS